ncbi:MAG: hypothetical protein HKN50_04065 [Gammaproteobacteria bacterium]|nr:hypothetical protein [Gammaproteobacteria bacterium]
MDSSQLTALDYFSLFANIAEISALILVLVTIYLVSQEIRETRRIFSANAQTQIGISASEFLASIYSDAELQILWSKGLRDINLLNEVERSRFYLILLSYWTLLANGFYMAQVDPKLVARIEGMLDLMIHRESVRQWWRSGAYNPSPEFKDYVNARIAMLQEAGKIPADSMPDQTAESVPQKATTES